jgi:hypothetical protein
MDRKGLRTTEFWLSLLVVVLGALQVAGLLGQGSLVEKVAGAVLAVLAQLGYGAMRVKLKLAAPAPTPAPASANVFTEARKLAEKEAEAPQEPAGEPAGEGEG